MLILFLFQLFMQGRAVSTFSFVACLLFSCFRFFFLSFLILFVVDSLFLLIFFFFLLCFFHNMCPKGAPRKRVKYDRGRSPRSKPKMTIGNFKSGHIKYITQ